MKRLRIGTSQCGTIFVKAKHGPDAMSKELGGTNAMLTTGAETSYPTAENSNHRAQVKLPGDEIRNACYRHALRDMQLLPDTFIVLHNAIH